MDLTTLLLPVSLLFVGAVLVLNGLWMLGRIEDREITIINFVTATITGAVALLIVLNADSAADIGAAALTMLFSVTYLWVGFNRVFRLDGRGLGWFSLFVAVTVLPQGLSVLSNAQGIMEIWLGLSWLAWSGLWLMYFFALALRRNIATHTAFATLGTGVATAWVPALVRIYGVAA
ncbi:AmiS/UreI family transporter [Loktanella sp. DSM 29012]|uniref:AmiS/UreI family transporter n=1 Tax=Loktanella sp. DSM 29012 TaxID=1881056 RepID=UPI0008B3ADBE|nr:AmiS/UreI family transporter [Loktanella sp. DSM 29012]SEQ83732.1 AmiS/UreI family transporter [Loktanella sp. DSM 29012]